MQHKKTEEKRYLVVGLGNPGKEFQNTPHNIGRQTIFFLAQQEAVLLKKSEKAYGLIGKYANSDRETFLLLPETFMNKSGLALKSALSYYKIRPMNLLVVQDDSDMELGKIKISFDQNSGGHRGIASIIQSLGSKKFARLKIGIRPVYCPQGGKRHTKAEKFIMRKMTAKTQDTITKIAKEAVKSWIVEGTAGTMNKYN
ncbi:MAG: aminoacyl-tRNA hydrolase [Candidatus Moranbacteria bacterium]|nr:aminoacyl-tRNA hydrolase [Candidatus Moranbacteria bacterium]